ncbi:hypothetical protein V5799_031898 [Amblyomma americanum]|uniref:Uncharacterized protein n=1 Tax=Amblyomma americanum TaxID=6943 RepID=A0AAQ4DSQ1_AMBAM
MRWHRSTKHSLRINRKAAVRDARRVQAQISCHVQPDKSSPLEMKSTPISVLLLLTLIVASECQMRLVGSGGGLQSPALGFQNHQVGVCGGICRRGSKFGQPCDGGKCVCGANFAKGPLGNGLLHCMRRVPRAQTGPLNGR